MINIVSLDLSLLYSLCGDCRPDYFIMSNETLDLVASGCTVSRTGYLNTLLGVDIALSQSIPFVKVESVFTAKKEVQND